MNLSLIAIVLATLVILLIPFLFFIKNLNKQRKDLISLSIIGYLVCAAPMLYLAIDHMVNESILCIYLDVQASPSKRYQSQ